MTDLSRLKALERNHVLDEATRYRRQKKAIDALEKDNFQDNLPSLTVYVSEHRLQLNRKLQQRFSVANESEETTGGCAAAVDASLGSKDQQTSSTQSSQQLSNQTPGQEQESTTNETKRKRVRTETKIKFARRTFANLAEEEHQMSSDKKFNYFSITVPPSRFPARKFCAVCGFPSTYTCIQCGTKYCCSKCLQMHKDTR